jgi:hypothetical protein
LYRADVTPTVPEDEVNHYRISQSAHTTKIAVYYIGGFRANCYFSVCLDSRLSFNCAL